MALYFYYMHAVQYRYLELFALSTFLKYIFACFIDTYMQKTKKTYTDSRTRRNLSLVSSELQDVQRIMVSNIDDVLKRGVALSGNKLLFFMTRLNLIA